MKLNSKKEKVKSANNPSSSKIKLKSADEVSEFAENIINTVREPLLALDQDLRVVKASRSFYDFFKVTSEETIGKLIYDLGNHQWDIPKLRELLETILPKKTTFDNYEVEHVFSTIGKRIMLLNARKIQRGSGKEQIILLAIEDITERRLAEKSLSETNRMTDEYLDILFNHAHAPIIIWDASFVITRINHAFEKLSGYDWTEVRDKKIDILFPKDKIDLTLELINNTLLSDERPELIEIDILTKDKDIKTVLWNSANIFDKEGKHIVATIAQDITKRKRTEEALTILETRYRRLFESAKDGILILDAETGKIIDVNPFLIELLGYSKGQFIEKEIWEIGLFKDIAANYDKFLELQKKGYVRYENLPLETADGRKINVEFVSNVYLVNHRKVVQCNIRDITERKRAEETLRNEQSLFRTLIDNIPDSIYSKDVQGRKTVANLAEIRNLGAKSEAEILGKDDFDFYPKELAEGFYADDQLVIRTGTPVLNREEYILNADGKKQWLLTSKLPLKDDKNKIIGLVGIGRDITERKQAEEGLRKTEKKFRLLFEQNLVGVYHTTFEGDILDCNNAFINMLGYDSLEELRAHKAVDLYSTETARNNFVSRLRTEGFIKNSEISLIKKNGTTLFGLENATLTTWDEDIPSTILGTIVDITERKHAEEKVRDSEERFRMVFENVFDGISLYNEDPDPSKRRLIECNERYAAMAGRSRDELLKLENTLGLQTKFNDKAEENRLESLERGISFQGSFSWIRPDGKENVIEYVGTPITWRGKSYTIGIDRDITERKRAEEVLRESEKKFRTVIEEAAEIIFTTNAEGYFTYANPIALKSSGYSLDELRQLKYIDLVELKYRQKVNRNYFKQYLERSELSNTEYPFRTKSGEIKWFNQNARLIIENNEVKGFYVIARDVTERRKVEEALHESEEKYHSIFENVQDVYYETSFDGTVLEVSPSIEIISRGQYRRENLIGRSMYEFYADTKDRDAIIAAIQKTGSVSGFEVMFKNRDSSLISCSISAKIKFNAQGNTEKIVGSMHDITERKRAEDKLKTSNEAQRIFAERLTILSETTTELSKAESLDELCRRAVELGRERLDLDRLSIFFLSKDSAFILGTYGVDAEGRITDERADRHPVGIEPNIRSILQSEIPLLRLADASLALKGQDIGQGSHVFAGLWDGNTAIGYLTVDNLLRQRPFSDGDCEIIRLYASAVGHLCSLKRTEETLRNERSQFRTIIDNIPDSIYSKDIEGRKTVANLAEIYNLGAKSEAEVLGKDDFVFFPKDLAEGFKVDDQLVLQSGTPVIDREEFVFDNSGKKRWLLTSKLPLKDANNTIIGLVGIGRDITERKRAEEEITMLAHSLRSVNECVSITDMEDKILFINESFLKTYGYYENELIGKHINIVRSLNNPPELIKEISPTTKRGGWQGELWNKREDGSEFPIFLSTTIIFDKEDKPLGLIGVATDITERIHAEKELIAAKEKAEQSDKLKSEFLAQMSHEIRTPINAIVGNVDYLNDSFGEKMDSEVLNCFDGIDIATKRIIRTVDLILNAAELQTSGYKPEFVTVDLNSEILNQLYEEHQPSAKQKGLELIYKCEVQETKTIADEYSITQIFANLIDNAIKFTKKGKVEILLVKNKTGNIMVEVKDTGIGISKEFLPKLFEPFVQEEQGYSRSFEGNGLGLALVKKYCEINNAVIEVESEKNAGSTFRIIFNKKL